MNLLKSVLYIALPSLALVLFLSCSRPVVESDCYDVNSFGDGATSWCEDGVIHATWYVHLIVGIQDHECTHECPNGCVDSEPEELGSDSGLDLIRYYCE